jgi:hypothetical protein
LVPNISKKSNNNNRVVMGISKIRIKKPIGFGYFKN